jgi:hypothetical protein
MSAALDLRLVVNLAMRRVSPDAPSLDVLGLDQKNLRLVEVEPDHGMGGGMVGIVRHRGPPVLFRG